MESVTPEDIRRFADRRAARDLEARRALHRRAAHDAGAIVEMIVREFNPERVVQWGSVLHPEHIEPEYRELILQKGTVVYER